jgi:phytoene dehydrogenase-like protein
VRLLTGSAADFLDDYFESELLKGLLSSSSIIGTKVGPRSQGSGVVLLFHNMGEQDGVFGSWGFHKGGNGGLTQVLARAAQSFGAEIVLEAAVSRVLTTGGRATGVVLADGTELHATGRGERARSASHVHGTGRTPRAARRPRRVDPALQVPGHVVEGELRARRVAHVPRSRRQPVPRVHQHRPLRDLGQDFAGQDGWRMYHGCRCPASRSTRTAASRR